MNNKTTMSFLKRMFFSKKRKDTVYIVIDVKSYISANSITGNEN